MTATNTETTSSPRRLTGRHVLFGLLGFFGIVFAVNGVFMYSALSTYTGVVSNEPYRKGLAYNERIAADERQAELKWHDTVSITRNGKISLALTDSHNTPVRGLQVAAKLGRPSTDRFDRSITLVETSDGAYAAETAALADGGWLVAVEARGASSADPIYRARKRVWLKP